MFNRNRSSFLTCFIAGLVIGVNNSRLEASSQSLCLTFMGLYAALRFEGDFETRLNRILGIGLGMTLGSFGARYLRDTLDLQPPRLR